MPVISCHSRAASFKHANFESKQVVYFGDPMCSWCWGFAPHLAQIAAHVAGRAQVHLVMGGLRTDAITPWDHDLKSYIRQHWQTVLECSGQPFDFSRFDDDQFIYNTELACRAVVTVRGLDETKTLPMFEALQRSFYADGLDITRTDVLAECAKACGIDQAHFNHSFRALNLQQCTRDDFMIARQSGITAFPSVVLKTEGTAQILTAGFQNFANLAPALEEWLIA